MKMNDDGAILDRRQSILEQQELRQLVGIQILSSNNYF